jgi:hypothetical protein
VGGATWGVELRLMTLCLDDVMPTTLMARLLSSLQVTHCGTKQKARAVPLHERRRVRGFARTLCVAGYFPIYIEYGKFAELIANFSKNIFLLFC